MTTLERFLAKTTEDGDCVLWTGATTKGYGQLGDGHGRVVYAHRYAWESTFGPIPDGMHVLHHCDNPRCVRPDHLFLGTNADNVADKVSKGRHHSPRQLAAVPKGERAPTAKLTNVQATEVRQLYAGGGYRQKDLAKLFGVTTMSINGIVLRRSYREAS